MTFPFEAFPKIPRARKLHMLITEKIDGTNAQIYIPADQAQPVMAGSRNRWITPNSEGRATDNYDFAAFVFANSTMLRRLGPGRHYGEWFGAGIGPRKYGLTGRRFALFDALRWRDGRFPEGLPSEVTTVPVLYNGAVDNEEPARLMARLKEHGSVAVPGYMNPEGIVVSVNGVLWKETFDAPKYEQAPTGEAQD